MADEPKQQSMTAEMIRRESARHQDSVITAFKQVQMADVDITTATTAAIHALGFAFSFIISSVSEVAAQLAEANSRDREAEVRAKSAEAFVAELAKAQSLVVPATVHVPRPKR